jgi:hypothetical protein
MRGLARVTFRALQPTIETELAAGWTAKAIYDRHADKLTTISYTQFARYCRQLKQPQGQDAKKTNQPTPQSGSDDVNSTQRKPHRHTGLADPATMRKLTRGE